MRLTSITLRPGAATARLVPSLSFHPTSTVSSARAPQACCILQPTMGFTAFPPSAHSIHLGFQIELLRPFTSIHLRAPGLPHSVRFEIPISNHPPKVFPPPQPYPVSFLKIEEGCKQRFFEVCSLRIRLCFRSGHFPGYAPHWPFGHWPFGHFVFKIYHLRASPPKWLRSGSSPLVVVPLLGALCALLRS
jgi:hypothetical protein